ncbi:MAG: hypothetical protein RLZZ508_439 [Actinomycetota bacterium]
MPQLVWGRIVPLNRPESPALSIARIARIAAIGVLVATVISGGAISYINSAVGNIKTQNIDDQLGSNRPEPGPAINLLLIGSDTRAGQGKGFGSPGEFGGQRSDTNILVHISENRDWATAVSIPRDTSVDMPDCTREDGTISKGYNGRFNEAFGRGGAACVIKTLETITDIKIDHFIIVDFTGFKNVVDALDGVDVCLTAAVNDQKSHLNLPKGISTIYGKDALAFVRARKTLGDGGDISRIRRQQDFLASMVRKATSKGILLNPFKVTALIKAVTGSLTTDEALGSVDGLKELAFNMQELRPSSVRFITAPWKPDPNNWVKVIFSEKATELWTALKNDIQWPAPPDNGPNGKPLTVAPSDVYLAVLNATDTSGLAAQKAELFADLGYNVKGTANAPVSLGEETAIYAIKGKEKQAQTLATAMGITEIKVLKKQGTLPAGLVVVVGNNWNDPKSVKIKTKPSSTLYGPTEGRAADETDCSPA